jgi:hypothetical protein
VEIARAIRSPEAARGLNNIGALVWGDGDLARARAAIDEAVHLGYEYGHVSIARHARGQQITLLIDGGDWENGLRAADEFIEQGVQTAVEDSVRRRRARVRFGRGDVAGAYEDLEAMLELARAMKDPQARVPSFGMAVRVYAEAGALDRARTLAAEFISGFPPGGPDWMLADFAWAAAALDRRKDLRRLLDATPSVTAYGRAARALLDRDYVTAAGVYGELGERENAALAQLNAAAQLVRDGRGAAAQELLENALGFFRSVGAIRYIADVDALRTARASAI